MPNYFIHIWLWRSGTLAVSINTNIHIDDILVRVSPTQPLTVCQLARNIPQMNIYEIHGALDTWNVIHRRMKLQDFKESNGPFYCVFGYDGMINFIIGNGDVYQVSPITGVAKLIIEWNGGIGDQVPMIATFKGGLVVHGPNSIIKVCFVLRVNNEVKIIE